MAKYKFYHRYNPGIVVFEGESLVGACLRHADMTDTIMTDIDMTKGIK